MKKILKYVLIPILICLVSYFCSFFINNYYRIINKEIKTNLVLANKVEKEKDYIKIKQGENKLEFTTENSKFIHNIEFNYNAKKLYNWTLEINGYNGYGKENYSRFDGSSSHLINTYVEKIDANVNHVTLTIQSEEEFTMTMPKVSNNIEYFNKKIVFIVLVTLSLYFYVIFRKVISSRVEYSFLYTSIVLGIFMLIFQPFGFAKSWDDEVHFKNTYGLVNKTVTLASKSYIDSENRWERFNTEKESDEYIQYLNKADKIKTKEEFDSKFSIKSTSYIGTITALLIAKVLHMNYYTSMLFGMLGNILLYIVLVYFAIRNTPICKKLMMCIGLIPTTMFMVANYTYDTTITAAILLGFSFLLKEYYCKDKISYKNFVIIILSFTLGTGAKAIYSPLLLLMLTLPKEKFRTKKEKYIIKAISVLGTIIMLSTFILPMITGPIGGDSRGGNTDGNSQLTLILNHPVTSLDVARINVVDNFMDKMIGEETISCNIWLYNRFVSNTYYIFIVLILVTTVLSNNKLKKELSTKFRITSVIINLGIIAMIWGTLFLSYTEIGNMVIAGVQGRYFIPILFPILLLFSTNKINWKFDDASINTTISIIIIIAISNSIYLNII